MVEVQMSSAPNGCRPVASQRAFWPDDAGLECATGGFAAVLSFQRHPIYRNRYIPVRGQILTLRHRAQR